MHVLDLVEVLEPVDFAILHEPCVDPLAYHRLFSPGKQNELVPNAVAPLLSELCNTFAFT